MHLDIEKNEYRPKRNIFEKLPIDLDSEKIFTEHLTTIWDKAKQDNKNNKQQMQDSPQR